MATTSIPAENYHLKWDSHLTYLNLSVATLYKNEKFADVFLLTSNPDGGGSAIPAHRIILSSCSHFFASIFDSNPNVSNGPIYIILPPELSRRAVQILIQYIYSGEATVSNDILNEVLRGGELLKIRGLCRSGNSGSNTSTSCNIGNGQLNCESSSGSQSSHHSQHAPKMGCGDGQPPIRMDEKQHCDLRTIGSNGTPALKESPVIVIPQPQNSHSHTHLASMPQSSMQSSSAQNISIKKDVAIDPTPASHYGLLSLHIAAAAKKAQQNNDDPMKYFQHADRSRRHSEDIPSSVPRNYCRDEIVMKRITRDEEQMHKIDRRRTSLPETAKTGDEIKAKQLSRTASMCPVEAEIPEALSILSIKQEPAEWHGEHDNEYNLPSRQPPPALDIVKSESAQTGGEEDRMTDRDDDDDMIYSPLTCELCLETFTVPGDWVRHIETHMDNPGQCLPKKRKRISEASSDYTASLKCDLCATYFVTPAEWVRHIQNTHTETELAISNKSALPRKKKEYQHDYALWLDRTCSICHKKFPSYASMVIHRRTHSIPTGKDSTTSTSSSRICSSNM